MRPGKPIIGISYQTTVSSNEIKNRVELEHGEIEYFKKGKKYIEKGEGNPQELAKEFFDYYDGLAIPGNDKNINPNFYNQKNHAIPDTPEERRTRIEIALVQEGLKRGVPILGICGGNQVINVALGGTLHPVEPDPKSSNVTFHEGTHLKNIMYPTRKGEVESMQYSAHGEAIENYHPIVVISSHDEMGVIKSIEITGHPWLMGTQFHPELAQLVPLSFRDESSRHFFKDFVDAVAEIKIQRQKKAAMHQQLLSLSSLEKLPEISESRKIKFISEFKDLIAPYKKSGLGWLGWRKMPEGIAFFTQQIANYEKKQISVDEAIKKIHEKLIEKQNPYVGRGKRKPEVDKVYASGLLLLEYLISPTYKLKPSKK